MSRTLRRTLALVLPLLLSAAAPADEPPPITPDEAIGQVGKAEVVVRMKVANAKDRLEKRGIIYLDSEPDFSDPKNLGVAISAAAAAKLKGRGIDDPAAHFRGKLIRVRGCVMRFEDRPYLPVLDPDQISLVDEE